LRELLGFLDRAAASGTAEWEELTPETSRALFRVGGRTAWQRALTETSSAAARARSMHHWFDGLKTLRFLHELRDGPYPMTPWDRAISELGGPTSSLESCLHWLASHDRHGTPHLDLSP